MMTKIFILFYVQVFLYVLTTSDSRQRIFKGNDAEQPAANFMACIVMEKDTECSCGGVVISATIILTAAHCYKPNTSYEI